MADEAKIENAAEAQVDEVKVDKVKVDEVKVDEDPKITHIIKALKDAQEEEYSLQASDEEIKEKKQKAQKQAQDIDINTLKLAFGKVLEQDAAATLEDPLEAEALSEGFEFARIIGELLTAPPGLEAKLDIYAYYKVGINQEPKKPGMFVSDSDVYCFLSPQTLGKDAC